MDNNPEILGVKNLCAPCLRHTNIRIPVNAPDRKKRAFWRSYAKSDEQKLALNNIMISICRIVDLGERQRFSHPISGGE
jgi:hypothetical protein